MTSPVKNRSWTSFYAPLSSAASLDIPPLLGLNFYEKYFNATPELIPTRSFFALKCPQVAAGAQILEKNLPFFNEAERICILDVLRVIFRQSAVSKTQETCAMECQRLKEFLGDLPFSLLISTEPLLIPKPAATFAEWMGSFFYTSLDGGASPEAFIDIIQKVLEMSHEVQAVFPLLERYKKRLLTPEQLSHALDRLKAEKERGRFPEKSLEESDRAFSGVKVPLSEERRRLIFEQYRAIQTCEETLKNKGWGDWARQVQKIDKGGRAPSQKDLLLLVSIGRQALKAQYGIYPYNTQILAVLALLSHSEGFEGSIAEVRTGEGKSTIITLLAFVHACFGKTVDVISSSPYLAQRDAQKYAPFFKRFHIATSCISTDVPSVEDFSGQIIYGTNYDFEFAWMRDQLSPKEKRVMQLPGKSAPRPFEVAVIDEVDNLLIDRALHSARIAVPAIQKTVWMYRPILEFVQAHKLEIENSTSSLSLKKSITQLRAALTAFQRGLYQKEVETFTNKKLAQWMHNAYSALYLLKESQEYTIQSVDLKPLSQLGARRKRKSLLSIGKVRGGYNKIVAGKEDCTNF